MRGKIDRVNNWKQFLNENRNNDIERQTKINQLERDIFSDFIKELIDSNDVQKMNEYIVYMKGKLWLSLNQFVHQKIYKLKDKNIKSKYIDIDYVDLDKKIDLFKKEIENL
jgi:hypothetical protein